MVVTTSSCQAPLATRFEVSGVDGGILVMPIDDERRGFHRDDDVETLGWSMARLHVEAPDKAGGRQVGEAARPLGEGLSSSGGWSALDVWLKRVEEESALEGEELRYEMK